MNNAKNHNGIVIVLVVMVVAVWGLGLAGWIKHDAGEIRLFKTGSFDTWKSHGAKTPAATENPTHTPPRQDAETAPRETIVQTPTPHKSDETAPKESTMQTPAPKELDASGVWEMTFRRYYAYNNEGAWESIGMEEVFLWMEVYPGKQFECDIMPYEGNINGEPYAEALASEPQLYTGEVVGNTLRLYLDLDNFYLNPTAEVNDTIEPDYIEIPITAQNGLPQGTYDYTWVATIDNDYDLQSRVTIELKKR